MNRALHALIGSFPLEFESMTRTAATVLICLSFLINSPAFALQDQGLSSVMDIIDRAIEEFQTRTQEDGSEEDKAAASATASATVVNLSRTLGKLSYSRLQCGEADVLAEFTLRVQQMPEDFRDPMRDAFQQGFDDSKAETTLLSEDECKRLTKSRTRGDKPVEAKVEADTDDQPAEQKKEEEKPKVAEDPRLKHLRIAELSGQLAFRRKFCGDKGVVSRDFNEVISKMPDAFQGDAKEAYWKGYKHGKRLNKGITQADCL